MHFKVLVSLALHVMYLSACSDIFKFFDNLSGTFEVIHSSDSNLTVCLELAVEEQVGGTGSLRLTDDIDVVKTRLKNALPIRYNVQFPMFEKPYEIRKIVRDGEVWCTTQDISPQRNVFSITDKISWIYGTEYSIISNSPCRVRWDCETCGENKDNAADELECGVSTKTFSSHDNNHSVKMGEWPWLVDIYVVRNLGSVFLHTGILISNQHILAPAKFFYRDNLMAADLLVVLGQHVINEWHSKDIVIRKPIKISVNRNYDVETHEANIAMIKIETLSFTDFIRPACLWRDNIEIDDMLDRTGIVVLRGFSQDSQYHTTPRFASVNLIQKNECKKIFSELFRITGDRFCADGSKESGLCRNLEGAGLYFNVSNQWTLRGILVENVKPCDETYSDVFTDVYKLRSWIEDNMNN